MTFIPQKITKRIISQYAISKSAAPLDFARKFPTIRRQGAIVVKNKSYHLHFDKKKLDRNSLTTTVKKY